MRSILREVIPSQAALEAEALEAEINNAPVLSLEEEVLAAGEQAAMAADILSDVTDSNRVIETTDVLENIASIGAAIEQATPVELQLMEAAGWAAVAGSDLSPDEIVPAMESYAGGKIALEALDSIRAKAKQIWANILAFIEKIWKKVTEFFYKIFGEIPRMRRSIADLEKKIDALAGKAAEAGAKLELSTNVASLSVDFQPVKGEGELTRALGQMKEAADYVYGNVSESVVRYGKSIEAAIKDFDPAKGEEQAKALVAAFEAAKPKAPPGGTTANKQRFPQYSTYIGHSLLGNVSVVLRTYTAQPDASHLGSLERFRASGWDLVSSSEKGAMRQDAKIEMPVLTLSEMKNVLKDVSKLLDATEQYKRGGKMAEVEASAKAVKAASNAAEKKLSSYQASSNADERNSVENYRALLSMNHGMASWASKPGVPMANHVLRSARAVMIVVQKSMAAYK